MRYLVLVVALCLGGAVAAAPGVPASAEEVILHTLKERYPDVQMTRVAPSKWPGLYEVYTADQILYSDASGELIIVGGHMVETRAHRDLTQASWSEANRIAFASLPLEQAIKVVRGSGSRQLAVFEDPRCPYCQELEKTLNDMQDITVYVFLLPLEELHPGARQTAARIWCSSDRTAEWLRWMKTREEPTVEVCANTPIGAIATLAEQLRINSTPTIFLTDGSRISGAVPQQVLGRRLDELRVADAPAHAGAAGMP